jgi:hypothetical protein
VRAAEGRSSLSGDGEICGVTITESPTSEGTGEGWARGPKEAQLRTEIPRMASTGCDLGGKMPKLDLGVMHVEVGV